MHNPIHQLVHTLSYGDAISGEVFALQRCFRSAGVASEIYAINVHPKYTSNAHDYRSLNNDSDGEVILHYSLGSPLNELYRSLSSARRTLIYHNLTPAYWFRGVNPRLVKSIERGMRELPELCALSHRLVADSRFNALELAKLGFNAQVLELPVDHERWCEGPNRGIVALMKADPGIHVLHVGRLAPNKCIEDVIRSFYYLHHYIDTRSKLWLVGIDADTEVCSFGLKRLVQALRLEGCVQFAGAMADCEVRALYEHCSVYLCMSEHEGFCLPVLEAMYFGLPVIAYSSSALPDTLGEGGILVNEKRHAEIAELMAEVSRNGDLRRRLIEGGRRRVQNLTTEHFRARVSEIFSPADSPAVDAQVAVL